MSESERERIASEIAYRLRRDGVRLSGRESGEELVQILESVERFENAVMRAGGDRMVDEPVGANAGPIKPDDEAFVLPMRDPTETVGAFITRIDAATLGVSRRHHG
jgi:hypothetical protein